MSKKCILTDVYLRLLIWSKVDVYLLIEEIAKTP